MGYNKLTSNNQLVTAIKEWQQKQQQQLVAQKMQQLAATKKQQQPVVTKVQQNSKATSNDVSSKNQLVATKTATFSGKDKKVKLITSQ